MKFRRPFFLTRRQRRALDVFIGFIFFILLQEPSVSCPIYTDEEFGNANWITCDTEETRNTNEYWQEIGVAPYILVDDMILVENRSHKIPNMMLLTVDDKKILSIAYRKAHDLCKTANFGACDILLTEEQGEWAVNNLDFTDSYVEYIYNTFFKRHRLYRAADRFEHPFYDVVFSSSDEQKDDISYLFFWARNASLPGENDISADEFNAAFNSIVKYEPDLKITSDNLTSYLGFYLFLTSKSPGDFIINTLDEYKLYCEIKRLCMDIENVIDELRTEKDEPFATKIEPIRYNNLNGWNIRIHVISFCGNFTSRTLTVLENGEIYLQRIEKDYPFPYDDYCYTF
jgi:hypothetical protein